MEPSEDLAAWLVKLILAGFLSFLWWAKKEDKKLLESHSEAITVLKTQAVTEEKVREIVTQATTMAVNPMYEVIVEVKKLVMANTDLTKELQLKMATQEGYRRAMKDVEDHSPV